LVWQYFASRRILKRNLTGGVKMFSKSDFWIGLAVGAVVGVFGYRFMQEREQQMMALSEGASAGQIPLAELERQKEELEDLIAAQKAQEK
jgi:hypothetical protein